MGHDWTASSTASPSSSRWPGTGCWCARTGWTSWDSTPPHTLDELREVAQAFTEGDPTGTGQETVGIIDRAESFLWGLPEVAGYFGAGAFFEESDDGTISPSFMTDPFKEAMAWYRDIYANGWMNQEFATMQKQNQLQAIAQDKAGIVFTALFEAPGYIATATSIDPDDPA